MKKFLLILFAILFSFNSYAKNTVGTYIGLGAGVVLGEAKNKYNKKNANPENSFLELTEKLDLTKVKTPINIFAGYNILPYLALEAEYNLGFQSPKKTNDISTLEEFELNIKNKYKNNHLFLVNVVGKYPILEQHIPFIKLGVGYALYKTNKYVGSENNSLKQRGGGVSLKIGAGYEFAITKHHSIIADISYVTSLKLKVKEKETSIAENNIVTKKRTITNAGRISYSNINVAYKFTL